MRHMKIYVASSWRNPRQPSVVERLRAEGHEVCDGCHPKEGDNGFHWSEIDPEWEGWGPGTYRDLLSHPVAEAGYKSDFDAMVWADVCVLVHPSGRSAHLEGGWFAGHPDKRLVFLLADGEPELMVKMADAICIDIEEVIAHLAMF